MLLQSVCLFVFFPDFLSEKKLNQEFYQKIFYHCSFTKDTEMFCKLSSVLYGRHDINMSFLWET